MVLALVLRPFLSNKVFLFFLFERKTTLCTCWELFDSVLGCSISEKKTRKRKTRHSSVQPFNPPQVLFGTRCANLFKVTITPIMNFQLTSQSPYMENYVREPYAYTIDVSDEFLLRATLEKIKSSKVVIFTFFCLKVCPNLSGCPFYYTYLYKLFKNKI